MRSVIVHILNEEAMVGELDDLPASEAQSILLRNPSRKDGKDIHFLDEGVNAIIIPLHRINFLQVLPSGSDEEIIGFVRE